MTQPNFRLDSMAASYAGRTDFLSALERLKKRFDSTAPVLEVIVRDPAMGVEGFIVVHNTAISLNGPLHGRDGQGCGKGGTRITPDVSLDEVRMLAHKMALKNAAAGLPMGGSKSGLKASSDEAGFEEKYRRFVALCKPFLFENGGVFGGFGFDVGAKPVHALWACEATGSRRCFTGKPLDMGGTDYDREGIAGYGVAVAAKAALEHQGKSPALCSFAVQGVGAMGAAVIRYFSGFGGRLVAVSDPRLAVDNATVKNEIGRWMFDKPVSQELLAAFAAMDVEKAKALLVSEAKPFATPQTILEIETDILFPCALHNVLHADNAGSVQAKMVIEGANSPCTQDAYNIFHDRGITVVPDFIANPGGVIAAFVEMTMDVPDDVNLKTKAKTAEAKTRTARDIAANVAQMLRIAAQYNVRCVDAGMYIALRRIMGEAA